MHTTENDVFGIVTLVHEPPLSKCMNQENVVLCKARIQDTIQRSLTRLGLTSTANI